MFLDDFKRGNTRKMYGCIIRAFFKSAGVDDEEGYKQKLLSGGNFESDVRNYLAFLGEKAPKTVSLHLTALKGLGQYLKQDTSGFKVLSRRNGGSYPLTVDRAPTKDELRRIHAWLPGDCQALMLVLASSGMRLDEGLSLEWGQFVKGRPAGFIVCRTKSGYPRHVFITAEAEKALTNLSGPSGNDGGPAMEGKVFGIPNRTALYYWHKALKNEGLDQRDPRTRRHVLHIHTLRKFWRTAVGPLMDEDKRKAIMGHRGLDAAYARYTREELAEEYLKAEKALTIGVKEGKK